jgi:hypothetical protein
MRRHTGQFSRLVCGSFVQQQLFHGRRRLCVRRFLLLCFRLLVSLFLVALVVVVLASDRLARRPTSHRQLCRQRPRLRGRVRRRDSTAPRLPLRLGPARGGPAAARRGARRPQR